MSKISVKQVKSTIGRTGAQKSVMESLGLRKINQVVEHDSTPVIMGMIKKVSHLVEVQEK